MASVNKVILIGNLGADPTVRYMPNGDAVANISIGCSESWKDKTSGEKKEATEWVRIVFFRKLAEIAGEWLKKGQQVYIEGKLQTQKYQKDGVDHYSTQVVADNMKMLGSKKDSSHDDSEPSPAPREQQAKPAQTQKAGFNDFEDDIPF